MIENRDGMHAAVSLVHRNVQCCRFNATKIILFLFCGKETTTANWIK